MIASCCLAWCCAFAADDAIQDGYIRTSDYTSCALTSLYIVSRLHDQSIPFENLKDRLGPPATDGTHSFADLARTAKEVGLHAIGLQADQDALASLPLPAIVHVRDRRRLTEAPHLLVLLRVDADGVALLDAPMTAYFLPIDQFATVWTGNVLVFSRNAEGLNQIQRIQWLRGLLYAMAVISAMPLAAVFVFAIRHWSFRLKRQLLRGGIVLTIVVAVTALFGLAINRPGSTIVEGPRCEMPYTVIDLGELNPGTFTAEVAVRNGGTLPLVIHRLQSSCTCAVGKPPDSMPSGAAAVIPVELSVTPGPRQARLTIESNDPQGVKRVMLTWHGRTDPVLIPGRISVASWPTDRLYERMITLAYPGGPLAPVPELEEVECASDRVEVRMVNSDNSAYHHPRGTLGESELRVSVQPLPEGGRFETTCLLKLRYGQTRRIVQVPILIDFFGGELTPEVSAVTFATPHIDELPQLERVVRINQRSAGGIELAHIPDWLSCQVERDSLGAQSVRFRLLSVPSQAMSHTVYVVRQGEPHFQVPIKVLVYAP